MNIDALSTQDKLTELSSIRHATAWNRVKIVLRVISLAVAVAALAESFILLPSPTPVVSPLLPITLSFACITWNCVVVILTQTGRDWMNQVRPVHIVIETLLWVIGITATAMQQASSAHASNLMSALTGSLAVLTVSHFTLFVRACVESRRGKRDKRVQELLQILVQESQRTTNLSTVSPPSCSESLESLGRGQQNHHIRDQVAPTAELPSKTIVVELAAVSEPVELPGDHEYIHSLGRKSSH